MDRLTFRLALERMGHLVPALEAEDAQVVGVSFATYSPDQSVILHAKTRRDLDLIVGLLENSSEPRLYGDYSAPNVEVFGEFRVPQGESFPVKVFSQAV